MGLILDFHPRGHSVVKHTAGWLEGLSQNPQNIYPKIAIKRNVKMIPLNIYEKLFLGTLKMNFIERKNHMSLFPFVSRILKDFLFCFFLRDTVRKLKD